MAIFQYTAAHSAVKSKDCEAALRAASQSLGNVYIIKAKNRDGVLRRLYF
ncbi:hypothetical protein APA_1386 [Pseudanabaena sp. lw0831]|nr:hypothetical protein APA_1386 [Pseudanabaena sp. lw0831]